MKAAQERHEYENRNEYLDSQVVRSEAKFDYCKVFFEDVSRYRGLIISDLARRSFHTAQAVCPILCLGVRAGAEVDIFRSVFFAPLMRINAIQNTVNSMDQSKLARNKSRLAEIVELKTGTVGRVWGVEINPAVGRRDIHVGSFDDLPSEWSGKFKILYSNSFDHSQDPARTVLEWKRVAAPGAYVIIAFVHGNKASRTDPLGGLSLHVMEKYWMAKVVFASETLNKNGYHEICFRVNED